MGVASRSAAWSAFVVLSAASLSPVSVVNVSCRSIVVLPACNLTLQQSREFFFALVLSRCCCRYSLTTVCLDSVERSCVYGSMLHPGLQPQLPEHLRPIQDSLKPGWSVHIAADDRLFYFK